MQWISRQRMRLGLGSSAGLVVSALATVLLTPAPAAAVTPGVAFSADNLSTWQTDGVVWALGQSHGRVVAGGDFTSLVPPAGSPASPVPVTGLAILDGETGAPDPCQLPVALPGGIPTVRAITTSADGNTVFVGGDFTSIGGEDVGRLAAIDVLHCTVQPWAPSIGGLVRALAVKGNVLYLGGDFTVVNGEPRERFAAIDLTTHDLLPWVADADAPGRPDVKPQGWAIGVSPDGTKVAIGGNFFAVNNQPSHSIAVVDGASGEVVRPYTGTFIPDASVTHTIWSGQDRFYVGNEGTGYGVFDGRIAISWETLDEVWRDTCLGATQAVLEYQGALYSASHAHDCSASAFQNGKRNYLMAQDAATSALLGWNPRANDGFNEHIGPRALTTVVGRTTGKTYLWAGGEFTKINDTNPQVGLTRFGPDDTLSPNTPTVVAEPTSDGTVQVRWRSVLDSDDSELTYRVYRTAPTSSGCTSGSPGTLVWQGSASSVWWKQPQVTFVDTSVAPGTTYYYRVRASDPAGNTSCPSTVAAAAATSPSSTYASTIRADHPSLYWNSTRTALSASSWWIHDVGAVTSNTRRPNGLAAVAAPPSPALPSGAPSKSNESPIDGDTSGSLSFDGVDDYVWEDEYVPGPAAYSVETWIKTTPGYNRGGQIINYGNGRPDTSDGRRYVSTSGKFDRMVYMENSGQIRFGTGDTRQTIRSQQPLNDGVWHHVVATQGSKGMALYVDGNRVGTNPLTTSASYNGVWHLGGDTLTGWSSQPTSTFFAGLIDETAIYPTVLNRVTVRAHAVAGGLAPVVNPRPSDAYGGAVFDDDPELYWRLADTTGTTAKDSSYFGYLPGRYEADVQQGAPGIPGNGAPDETAVSLPGSTTGTLATQTAVVPPRVFSSEVWFKTTTTSGGKLIGFEDVSTGSAPSSNDKNLYMTDDGRLEFGTFDTSLSSFHTITSPSSYNDGAWHHVVAVLSEAGQRLYVDGKLVGSDSSSTSQSFTGYWRIGGGNLGTWPDAPSSFNFQGALDEVAIYHSALSRPTVLRHYAIGRGDTEPPSVPTDLTATAANGAVALSWSPSTDDVEVVGYSVYRGATAGFTPNAGSWIADVAEPSYNDAGRPVGTYYYKVIATDAAGNISDPSLHAAATVTEADTSAPSAPSGVAAVVSGPGAVTVSWASASDGVTRYSIYRGSTAGFAASPLTKVGEAAWPATSFDDTNVPHGEYFYKVVATDAAGNSSSAAGSDAVTVPDHVAPSAPTGVSASVSGAQVSLVWSPSSDDVAVDSYRIYRGTTSSFTVDPAALVGQTNSTAYTDSPPTSGAYHYTVVAADAAGNASEASDVVVATVAPPGQTPVITNLSRPKITGKNVVGKVLRVSTGKWSPTTVSVSYQWFADGVAVKKATRAAFKLTVKQVGKKMTVRVTATAAGATTGAVKTKPSARIKPKPSKRGNRRDGLLELRGDRHRRG
jgi:hypothetical protein